MGFQIELGLIKEKYFAEKNIIVSWYAKKSVYKVQSSGNIICSLFSEEPFKSFSLICIYYIFCFIKQSNRHY